MSERESERERDAGIFELQHTRTRTHHAQLRTHTHTHTQTTPAHTHARHAHLFFPPAHLAKADEVRQMAERELGGFDAARTGKKTKMCKKCLTTCLSHP